MMVKLNEVRFENDGRRIVYDYEYDSRLSKYFNKSQPFFVEYDTAVSHVPLSICVIPFLANVMPMSWFIGFDVYANAVDKTFFQSLADLKSEFTNHFPNIDQTSALHAQTFISNTFSENNMALLFSGGLDSFESLTRNLQHKPYLVSVLGADIEIGDDKHWDDFVRFNSEEKIVDSTRLFYVKSNLRTYYTYEMDLIASLSWWGTVQHGMALLSLIAPLSYLKNIGTILIASSNTSEVNFGWGSTSETDEKVKWANARVIHDGFHLRRTEKIENIVAFAKKTGHYIKLRVCYNDLRQGYNCSRCAKCQRTMLGFMLCGENPDLYGFNTPDDFYTLLFKNFDVKKNMTTGVAYEWTCLQQKAKRRSALFVIKNEPEEKNNIDTFAALELDKIIDSSSDGAVGARKMKHIVINTFPGLFKMYLRIRRKF